MTRSRRSAHWHRLQGVLVAVVCLALFRLSSVSTGVVWTATLDAPTRSHLQSMVPTATGRRPAASQLEVGYPRPPKAAATAAPVLPTALPPPLAATVAEARRHFVASRRVARSPTATASGAPLRVAIFERNAFFHTECIGVLLAWARARGHTPTLFVRDTTSYRSFIPAYEALFGPLDVRYADIWPTVHAEFNVTVFITAAPPVRPRFPPRIAEVQRALPHRMVYLVHHVEKLNNVLEPHQRRVISMTPLLASPYLTPLFTSGDAAWGPRLRFSQRSRTVCAIGSGLETRYNKTDLNSFLSVQELRARVPAAAAAAAATSATTGVPVEHAYRLGQSVGLPAPSSSDPPPSHYLDPTLGVVWEPATLSWRWPPLHPAGQRPPWRLLQMSIRGRDDRVGNNSETLARTGLPPDTVASLRGPTLPTAMAAVKALLAEPPFMLNDARPRGRVAAFLINFDVPAMLESMRHCAFLLIHPRPDARELHSRMSGALPTALIARTPLLAPRAFTDIYGLTSGSLAFNVSLKEVAAALDDMDDAAYDVILDALDARRVSMEADAHAQLDAVMANPDWEGIDELGPGWNVDLPAAEAAAGTRLALEIRGVEAAALQAAIATTTSAG